jgi:small-conductance mechanosensitive channel
MDFFARLGDFLSDDRLLINLIAIHVLLAATLIASILVRSLLIQGSTQLFRFWGLARLDGAGQEAVRRLRVLLFWSTVGVMTTTVVGGIGYHLAGRDIRHDLAGWYEQLTWAELIHLVVATAELILLAFAGWLIVRQLRRWLPRLHAWTRENVHKGREEALERWFFLLERYAVTMLFLVVLWCAGHIVGLAKLADSVVGFFITVLTILSIAHLLTMASSTLSHALATWGNRCLGQGQFHRYWERITRLFPFGERCFEAAVYVQAATLIIRETQFIAVVAQYGPKIIECIGIFFGTRVLIELLQVLLSEAFGLYKEERQLDQRGETLVPLLQSAGQYVLYFGAGVMMLSVLDVPTGPILAGAGLLGLGVGLGAQSLVTDVVSGFFILFEIQYLVGDYVKINDAAGRVEAVTIRLTQIRDDQGRLHIIPNGQIKGVINCSKTFVNAEVDIKVSTDRNVHEVFQAMAEAGRRLRQSRKEVLADTVIKGIVDMTPGDMTIRAVTKVMPGTHHAMQNEYRRQLREVFDEQKKAAQEAQAQAQAPMAA